MHLSLRLPVLSLALSALIVLPPGAPARAADGPGQFPLRDLLPKSETGATQFLKDHSRYDGRGIVVAIFDTGVDPGAPGMQVTSDGKPKIIDLVDGSGSGDVVTTTVRKKEDGKLLGLTGRELKTGKWKNPTGEYRLGIKAAWELYPRALVGRMKTKRREAWDEAQRERLAAVSQELNAWDAAHPSPTEAQLRDRSEIKARIELLEEMQESYDDPGPVFDCVVFHDGTHWRGVVDTDEDGDLSDEKAMTNFRVAREWSTFDAESLLNFGVNIYDEGNLLSIVADCGAHGTHVAGIVAANYPKNPELNGVAPGAQIVAVKIGDTRLGSSSMGTGQVRGLVAALENNCDVINMSYGGSSPLPNYGYVERLYEEIVYEKGVIFVSTSGNEGPALSTAGTPGGTTEALIGVGAYVSGDMMKAQYSLREKLPDTQYTWSSRGPTLDGALGVDFSAPGGAIAPVPNWILQPNTLMNGTSMAAPSVAGGIACLLSGLKQKDIPWTPQHVKRTLANTAVPVEGVEPWALGHGLIRIDRAWDVLSSRPPYSRTGVRFDVSIGALDGARGIYLREAGEQVHPTEVSVSVDPRFRNDVDNREKVDFQLQAAVSVDADWVQVPDVLHLHAGGRSIRVLVDPRDLPPGAHFAEIVGTDLADPERGPIFRIPVTVIRPLTLPADNPTFGETLSFRPGEIQRRFFAVPDGATWADIVVRGLHQETDRRLVLHTLQLDPGLQYDLNESQLYSWVGPGEDVVRSIPVIGGRTLEVTLAQYWSSLGQAEFSYEITFHGLRPSDEQLFLDGAFPTRRTRITAAIGDESIAPSARVTTSRATLRPTDYEIRPLPGTRDLLPEGKRVHELVLTYEFEQKKKGKLRPYSTLNEDERLWEYWESGMWMVFDEAKQLLATGPRRSPLNLDEGKYTLRYHVRHHDVSRLEGVVALPMHLERELGSPVSLSMYSDAEGAIGGSQSLGNRDLKRGDMQALWVESPTFHELPDGVEAGDLLLGTIGYGRERSDRVGSGKRPEGWPLAVRVPGAPNEKKDPEATDEDESDDEDAEEGAPDKLDTELREKQLELLATLRTGDRADDFERLAKQLSEQPGDALPLLLERMRFAEGREDARTNDVVSACDAVIAAIDAEQVAAALGVDVDPDDKAGETHRKEMESQRDSLVEAIRTKCTALQKDEDEAEAFEAAYRELDRWSDMESEDNAPLLIERERRRGRLAVALQTLNARIEDQPTDRKLREQRGELLEELGWSDWVAYEDRWMLRRFPTEYAPF